MHITLISSLFCLFSIILSAQAPAPKDELSEKKLLKENGFVITKNTYRQGFSAYIGTRNPKFITSDSLLMAYTDLLERSIADKHILILADQRELISKIAAKLPKPSPDNKAITATRLVIGTAHRILFGKISSGFTEAEKKLIEKEAVKVETHKGSLAPSWWVKEKHLPYSRFAVPSPWDENDIYKQYYRYTQWMMSMPFDNGNPDHQGIEKVLNKTIKDAFIYYRNNDDLGLIQAIVNTRGQNEVKALIQYKNSPDKTLLDQVLYKETSLKNLTRVLATSFDNKILPSESKYQQLITELKELDQPLFTALRALNQPAETQAPKLFSSKAWQRKQINTTLGAWAEYRHALGITQKDSAFYASATREPVGFVEPVPEFYQALGIATEELARKSLQIQNKKIYKQEFLFALHLEKAIKVLEKDYAPYDPSYSDLETLVMFSKGYKSLEDNKSRKMLADKLRQITQEFWLGKPDKINDVITSINPSSRIDTITPNLRDLSILCYRLEAMSRKQLANIPWSKTEEKFIQNYGKKLANIMHYFGNSYLSPRDDAPSIIQIAHLVSPFSENTLLCGNARPRQLLIHYPDHNGKPILCQGAVYSYREVISEKPITDKTWRKSSHKSSPPTWLTPIISN